MQVDVLNVRDLGVVPKAGHGETNRIALQQAIDAMQAAGGGTILVPIGIYEIAGAIDLEVSTMASAAGTICITGEGGPTLVQQDESNLFVVTDVGGDLAVGRIVLQGLQFQGNF